MKWTTSNIKNPNYLANHEIYVGSQTGSFKQIVPAYKGNPFAQKNLQDLSQLNNESRITSLSFGNEECSEILIGRHERNAQIYSLRSQQIEKTVAVQGTPTVGLARFGEKLIAGFGDGKIQCIPLKQEGEEDEKETVLVNAGDNISRLRQCSVQRNLVATGGKERQNNLKVFDMNADGKKIFTSKNLPNDALQLEVPVWDSDVGFINSPHILATCSRHGYVRVYDTRKQRRPVQNFATNDQLMSFSTLAAHDNYIYTGTTTGIVKAFDIRRMKTFVHTYKGFTGAVSDLHLDSTGKYLTSASLDRYVRVHDAESCVLLYQCYVKSKAVRVLIRDSLENPNAGDVKETEDEEADGERKSTNSKKIKTKNQATVDSEYDDMFNNMQTICESKESNDEAEDEDNEETTGPTTRSGKTGIKRKAPKGNKPSKKKG